METEPDESLDESVDGDEADPAPAVDPVRRLDQRERQHRQHLRASPVLPNPR